VLWLVGGRLVVYGIDALLEVRTSRRSRLQTAHLRFRTLRLLRAFRKHGIAPPAQLVRLDGGVARTTGMAVPDG